MRLTINVYDKYLYCINTNDIETVKIINDDNSSAWKPCVEVCTILPFGTNIFHINVDTMKDCRKIYDRIIYCITNSADAISFSKEYLRIGCKEKEDC